MIYKESATNLEQQQDHHHQHSLAQSLASPHHQEIEETQQQQDEEENDPELLQLQLEVQEMALKVHRYRNEGASLFVARLQQSLEAMRPRFFSLDPDDRSESATPGGSDGLHATDVERGEDEGAAQFVLLKAKIAALDGNMRALLKRMKGCIEELDERQKVAAINQNIHPAFRE